MCKQYLTEKVNDDLLDLYVIHIAPIVCVEIIRCRKGSMYNEKVGIKYFELHKFIKTKLNLFSNNVRYEQLKDLLVNKCKEYVHL